MNQYQQKYYNTKNLLKTWSKIPGQHPVIIFSLNHHTLYGCFSNFYKHKPFLFKIPNWCGIMAGFEAEIEFSEKAILLCKASLMNDILSFNKILSNTNPYYQLKINNWNQKLWEQFVCLITKEVVETKFKKVDGLKEILFLTKNHLIALASSKDKLWGIGMDESNPDFEYPSKWKGLNILGWALMELRDKLLEKDILIRLNEV